ncbi:MAG: anti-sigma factor [Clostridia bacterium]|nr:anti-sigma factor [Clostridia bacterium]
MSDCEKFEAMIDAYLDNDLTNDKRQEFSEHISSCEKCREALSFAEGVKKSLKNLPEIEVPADFSKKVTEQVSKGKKNKKTATYIRRYGTLAACLVIAVVLARVPELKNFGASEKNQESAPITIQSPNPSEIKAPSPTEAPDMTEIRSMDNTAAEIANAQKEELKENSDPDTSTNTDIIKYALDVSVPNVIITTENGSLEEVKKILDLFESPENGVYTFDRSTYTLMLDALSHSGLDYSISGKQAGDSTKVMLK